MSTKKKTIEPLFNLDGAACVDSDPDIFMPEGKNHIQITRQAKGVCSTCPLLENCLDYATRNNEWGIWGGTTMKERLYLRRHPYRKAEYLKALRLTGGQRDIVTLTDENKILD